MTLGELKELVNSISSEYDDYKLYDGNEFLGAPEVTLNLAISNYLGHDYIDMDFYANTRKSQVFSDLGIIADKMRAGQKIQAIKEIRQQTHMSLKDAKEYIERYMPMGFYDIKNFDCDKVAGQFVGDHLPKDFLDTDEMKL